MLWDSMITDFLLSFVRAFDPNLISLLVKRLRTLIALDAVSVTKGSD